MWACTTCTLNNADAVTDCAACGDLRAGKKRPREEDGEDRSSGGRGGGSGSGGGGAGGGGGGGGGGGAGGWQMPAAASMLDMAFAAHGPAWFGAYRLPAWALLARPPARSDALFWKVVVLGRLPPALVSATRASSDQPPAHITIAFWTERGAGTPLTGARVAAMGAIVARFQGARVAVVGVEGGAGGRGVTAPSGALVRLRRALVTAANGATPAGQGRLRFRSSDGGEEAIAQCHVTRGLAPPRALLAGDASDAREAAWLQQLQQGGAGAALGWVLPLQLELVAREAPLACNDALHQTLLWAPDSNRAATAVARAGVEVTGPAQLRGLSAEGAGHVQHALQRLRETGRGPCCAPQCG